MLSVAEKILTIPFGAEIPPELSEAFTALIDEEGWVKKRTLAAAVRAFLLAAEADRNLHYRDAYKSIEAVQSKDAVDQAAGADGEQMIQDVDQALRRGEQKSG